MVRNKVVKMKKEAKFLDPNSPYYEILKKIEEKNQKKKKDKSLLQKEKFDKIDAFLEKKPKITPQKEVDFKASNVLLEQSLNKQAYTETLAKIYLEQNQTQKALEAYQFLMLKFPEKSSYFAEKIQTLKKK
ncbi:MAG: hypothetical protein C4K58_03270 [Flavobacteriaceae bacterium]|nr:MAG: hypothetical protein C4K58_03270 [Flavobacteriaceae bacterium]